MFIHATTILDFDQKFRNDFRQIKPSAQFCKERSNSVWNSYVRWILVRKLLTVKQLLDEQWPTNGFIHWLDINILYKLRFEVTLSNIKTIAWHNGLFYITKFPMSNFRVKG